MTTEKHKTLAQRLIESGVMECDLFGRNCGAPSVGEILETIQYIPEENIGSVLEKYELLIGKVQAKSGGKGFSVQEFCQAASKEGLLKFKPYIVDKDSITYPSLVLKYNRYLHLFRGYDFHVSYTCNGIGEYDSAGLRLDVMLRALDGVTAVDGKYQQMLVYMNALKAGWGIDEFRDMIKENEELFDEFIETTLKKMRRRHTITFGEICKMLQGDWSILMKESTNSIFRIQKTSTADYGHLHIYNPNLMMVEIPRAGSTNTIIMKFPTPYEMDKELYDKEWEYEDEEDIRQYIKALEDVVTENETMLMARAAFILNCAGFITNFIVTYPIDASNDTLKGSYVNCSRELRKLDDVLKYKEIETAVM